MGLGKRIDFVAGQLSRLLHLRAAKHNTVGDLGPYLDRTAAELGVERGCCPSVVMRDPMKHAGRDLSCGGYHLVELTRLAPASTEIGAVGRHVIP